MRIVRCPFCFICLDASGLKAGASLKCPACNYLLVVPSSHKLDFRLLAVAGVLVGVALGVAVTLAMVSGEKFPSAADQPNPLVAGEPRSVAAKSEPKDGTIDSNFENRVFIIRTQLNAEFGEGYFAPPMISEPWAIFLQTGHPQEAQILAMYKEALDQLYVTFRNVFPDRGPVHVPLTVIVFKDRGSFDYYCRRVQGATMPEAVTGFFDTVRKRTVTHHETNAKVLSRLLHEGTHQIIGFYNPIRDDTRSTFWFHEGLGAKFEAFEAHKVNDYRLSVDNIGKFNDLRHGDGRMLWNDRELWSSWLNLQRVTALTIKEFWEWFQGAEDIHLRDKIAQGYYAVAWALTYYMLEHEDERYREAYIAYMGKELSRQGGRKAFRDILQDKVGITVDQLQVEFDNFICAQK